MTLISKNMYMIYQMIQLIETIKIKVKPVDVKLSTFIDFEIEDNDKDPKFKVGDLAVYSNIKTFLQKITLQTSLKKLL